MIHRIYSTLRTFKTLEFHPGLNVLIAKKELDASDRQTRNRAGKTSMIEIVHFLTGADAGKDSLFRTGALVGESFGMEFDLAGKRTSVERSGNDKSKVRVSDASLPGNGRMISNLEWCGILGERMFGLNTVRDAEGRTPTFRSLFAYFVRRQNSGAFTVPEKQATMQQTWDFQVALMYLFGIDWNIAGDWQKVREREKTVRELRKVAGSGAFGNLIGKTSDLRTQLALADARLKEIRSRVQSFRVLPQYRELETEADHITQELNSLANDTTIDAATIRNLKNVLETEAPPSLTDLESIYAEAGIALPGITLRRYDEVRSFHESVIRNRRDYLSGELSSAQLRMESREMEKERLDLRRSEIMGVLRSHGALEQFSRLQGEASRLEAEAEALRQRFEAAEQLEGTKNELEIERSRLTLRLRRDFAEEKQRLEDAILAFEETSHRLYEKAGSMKIDVTQNGPEFKFHIQGAGSKGIRNMQIFCFDLMLMRLCAKRGIGPGFLIHDSHLFDGVDGRQVISALKLGAETAEKLGFQYIVTMNEDDAFKENIEGFDIRNYILPVELTDASEDGGLFGFRF